MQPQRMNNESRKEYHESVRVVCNRLLLDLLIALGEHVYSSIDHSVEGRLQTLDHVDLLEEREKRYGCVRMPALRTIEHIISLL